MLTHTITRVQTTNAHGVLWRCDSCDAWWGSQVGATPQTNFLHDLPATVSEALPWEDYRGWISEPLYASVCPQCGKTVQETFYSREPA